MTLHEQIIFIGSEQNIFTGGEHQYIFIGLVQYFFCISGNKCVSIVVISIRAVQNIFGTLLQEFISFGNAKEAITSKDKSMNLVKVIIILLFQLFFRGTYILPGGMLLD